MGNSPVVQAVLLQAERLAAGSARPFVSPPPPPKKTGCGNHHSLSGGGLIAQWAIFAVPLLLLIA